MTHPGSVDRVIKLDGCSEAVIDDYHHHLPHHLHESDAMVVTSPLGYQYYRLSHGLLLHKTLPEVRLDEIH